MTNENIIISYKKNLSQKNENKKAARSTGGSNKELTTYPQSRPPGPQMLDLGLATILLAPKWGKIVTRLDLPWRLTAPVGGKKRGFPPSSFSEASSIRPENLPFLWEKQILRSDE